MKQLYYCGKKDQILDSQTNTLKLRKYIELVPKDKNEFDICSLIDFIDSITKDFLCTTITSRQQNITIIAKHKDLPTDSISFKIQILNNFSFFQVNLRDGLHYMNTRGINGINYICFESFSNNQENFIYFTENFRWDDKFPYKNSVLYKLGKFLAKNQTNAPLFLKNSFKGFLHPKTNHINRTTISHIEDFIDLVHHLPGFVYIKYRKIAQNCDNMNNSTQNEDNNNNNNENTFFEINDDDYDNDENNIYENNNINSNIDDQDSSYDDNNSNNNENAIFEIDDDDYDNDENNFYKNDNINRNNNEQDNDVNKYDENQIKQIINMILQKGFKFNYNNEKVIFKSLIWIMPWAVDISSRIQ